MLTVHHVSKSYGIEIILNEVSFSAQTGDRLGLVGPNGSGKTTLLKILIGEEKPDNGVFHFNPPSLRLGYLPQGLTTAPGQTIGAYLDQRMGNLEALSIRIEMLSRQLSSAPRRQDIELEYDALLDSIQAASLSAQQLPEVLAALELDQFAQAAPVAQLSGGQKTRLALAGILLSSPHLLLLDEPTNHLDIEMLSWLENWLINSPLTRHSAALIVSHDRVFLDRTVNGILELDPTSHQLRVFQGNYSDYLEQTLVERERYWQAYSDQKEEIARLRHAVFRGAGKGCLQTRR